MHRQDEEDQEGEEGQEDERDDGEEGYESGDECYIGEVGKERVYDPSNEKLLVNEDHDEDKDDRIEALGLRTKYEERMNMHKRVRGKQIKAESDEHSNEDDDDEDGSEDDSDDSDNLEGPQDAEHDNNQPEPNDQDPNETKPKKPSKKKRNFNDQATVKKLLVRTQQRNKKAPKFNENKVKEKSKLTRNLLY